MIQYKTLKEAMTEVKQIAITHGHSIERVGWKPRYPGDERGKEKMIQCPVCMMRFIITHIDPPGGRAYYAALENCRNTCKNISKSQAVGERLRHHRSVHNRALTIKDPEVPFSKQTARPLPIFNTQKYRKWGVLTTHNAAYETKKERLIRKKKARDFWERIERDGPSE